MWSRSPIFRRLLLSCLLLVFVTISVLDFFLTRLAEQQQKAAVESQLAAEARLLADELAAVPGASLQAWTKQAEKRAQARITIIDHVGIVRADSQGDPESMENHAQRPEVREAMQGRAGSAVRRSRTLNRELAYLAVPLQYEGNSGFVLRLAIPVQQIHIAASDVRNRIL